MVNEAKWASDHASDYLGEYRWRIFKPIDAAAVAYFLLPRL